MKLPMFAVLLLCPIMFSQSECLAQATPPEIENSNQNTKETIVRPGGVEGLKGEVRIIFDQDTGQVTILGDPADTAIIRKAFACLQQEHGQMRLEHETALAQHKRWEVQIGKMRVDHSKALAALAQLQAEILAHTAELDDISSHILQHEVEIANHNEAMHHRDKGGTGDQHDHKKTTHDDIMKHHQALAKQMEAEAAHHHELTSGIIEFAKEHAKKFHSDGAEGGTENHSDHAHPHEGHGH